MVDLFGDMSDEEMDDMYDLQEQRDELKEQRDELLEALEFLTRHPEEEWAWQDAYAAIAKARGK